MKLKQQQQKQHGVGDLFGVVLVLKYFFFFSKGKQYFGIFILSHLKYCKFFLF